MTTQSADQIKGVAAPSNTTHELLSLLAEAEDRIEILKEDMSHTHKKIMEIQGELRSRLGETPITDFVRGRRVMVRLKDDVLMVEPVLSAEELDERLQAGAAKVEDFPTDFVDNDPDGDHGTDELKAPEATILALTGEGRC